MQPLTKRRFCIEEQDEDGRMKFQLTHQQQLMQQQFMMSMLIMMMSGRMPAVPPVIALDNDFGERKEDDEEGEGRGAE
jgi:hypothetical protein